jgi:hypothetical protein
MDRATFADRFFGRGADDPVAHGLRSAAELANVATSPADMAQAAGKLADAMKRVGLDRWPRFVADAQTRARDPATEAAIEKSLKPIDPQRDAIRPVYPLEALTDGAGIRGATASARAVGRAISGVGPYAALLHEDVNERYSWITQPENAPTPLAAVIAAIVKQAGFQLFDRDLASRTITMNRPDGTTKATLYQALFTDTDRIP